MFTTDSRRLAAKLKPEKKIYRKIYYIIHHLTSGYKNTKQVFILTKFI